MRMPTLVLAACAIGSLSLAGATLAPPLRSACAQEAHVSYTEDIAPILKGWCVSCHQPGGQGVEASGLDLTSYDAMMKGTKFGPMIIPGQPDSSNLIVLIEGRAQIRMPYGHKALPACLRQNVWTWIFEGAQNN